MERTAYWKHMINVTWYPFRSRNTPPDDSAFFAGSATGVKKAVGFYELSCPLEVGDRLDTGGMKWS